MSYERLMGFGWGLITGVSAAALPLTWGISNVASVLFVTALVVAPVCCYIFGKGHSS